MTSRRDILEIGRASQQAARPRRALNFPLQP